MLNLFWWIMIQWLSDWLEMQSLIIETRRFVRKNGLDKFESRLLELGCTKVILSDGSRMYTTSNLKGKIWVDDENG